MKSPEHKHKAGPEKQRVKASLSCRRLYKEIKNNELQAQVDEVLEKLASDCARWTIRKLVAIGTNCT